MSSSGKIKVLSTIAMIEDLVKQVGGDHVITLTLVKGDLDPHSYQLVKGDDEKLASADVIFYNGLGLEHGPSLRNYLETNSKAIGLGDLVRKENPGLILSYNGSMDPHIWTDIQLWNRTVKFITETLETYDPTHASVYKENGQKLEKAMEALHFKLKNEMKEVPPEKRYLITSHDAFNYFARAYLASEGEIETGDWQNRFAAPEGLAPESQLSTTDIRLILDHMKKYDIHVIFPESNVSQASIRKLLSAGLEQGIRITISPEFLYGDAMGAPGSNGDSYFKMIKHNIRTIAKYLKDDDRSQK
jgi:manganese/zinc/iron transport system substrate-binding protein